MHLLKFLLSKKSKKFKPVPTQSALKAAQQAVTTAMAKMPVTQTVQQQPPATAPRCDGCACPDWASQT